MAQDKEHIYKGFFHAQFVADNYVDKPGWKFMNFKLEQRFVFKVLQEVGLSEYLQAKEKRLSEESSIWQSSSHPGFYNDGVPFKPHVYLNSEQEIELEFPNHETENEICSELLVEFNPELVPEPLRAYDFVAFKDKQYHGRITGLGFVRILDYNESEKIERRAEISAKKKSEILQSNNGCSSSFFGNKRLLPRFLSPNNPLFGNAMGGGSGCTRTGCGCISLLMLLGLLFALWKGCSEMNQLGGGPRVIHDTVFVDEKSKEEVIKRFMDTTTVLKTSAVELPNVQFYTNSAKLLPYSISSIQELANYLTGHPHIHAVIEGHTDNIGKADKNLILSQNRAETVRQVLVSLGVDPSRVEAQGFGSTKPRASNENVEGRALNRRVEVRLTNTETSTTKTTEIRDEK
jgi:outer membrane protein OmpA-like peptidoglycan-associated protein